MKVMLKSGKFYKTRGGYTVYCYGETPFPMSTDDRFICERQEFRHNRLESKLEYYFENGNWFAPDGETNGENEHDIVEEIE